MALEHKLAMPKNSNSTQILNARRDGQNMEALAKSCTAKEATFYNAKPIASCKRLAKIFTTHVRQHSQTHIGSNSSRERKTDGHGCPT